MSGLRVLFLDRDGTLNEEPPDEQVDSLEKIKLLPGVIPALLDLKRAGFTFVMVTNQDGLGTQFLSREAFEHAHRFILALFASQGITFYSVFVCPHFKRENCACRKPKTGMIQKAVAELNIDLKQSWLVGDKTTYLQTARNAGVKSILLRTGHAGRDAKYRVQPDFAAENLLDAVNLILSQTKL